jgi:hypothetical protein
MAKRNLMVAVAAGLAGLSAACSRPPARFAPAAAKNGLAAFESQAALISYMRNLALHPPSGRIRTPAARTVPAPGAPPAVAETVTVQAESALSITNVQQAGVDEGGIVKLSGDYLVVLRRGRLFTVEVGGDALRAADRADAFGIGIDPRDAWYDEMLAADGRVVVLGYSYERGGTELGRFDLSRDGGIRYRDTYHLKSDDYYSDGNYASRLIGRTLVFYTPFDLLPDPEEPLRDLPALRRWLPAASEDDFWPIYSPQRLYRPLVESSTPTLHTVTTCDLAARDLSCTATGIIGPPGRVFYVSGDAVYVWMTEWAEHGADGGAESLLYRLSLDGGEPQALRVSGGPVDQFSFLEADGHLNVLVRSESQGDGMWRAKLAQGDIALLRLPLSSFGNEVGVAPPEAYRPLPRVEEDGDFHNRFAGDYLLYGSGGWGPPGDGVADRTLVAHRYAGDDDPVTLRLAHTVERIEVMGRNAVVVGGDGRDLHFSTLALGERPEVRDDFRRADAAPGEQRSHGFFYQALTDRTGVLGLPILGAARGDRHSFAASAAVLFLSNEDLRLRSLGELAARLDRMPDDRCRASCVDWYGNARPLFLGDRILGLLGYELVEGRLADGRVSERRRINFGPAAAAGAP